MNSVFANFTTGITYAAWRKLHRDTLPEGPFRHRSHPIKKKRLADRTIFQCLRCRLFNVFVKEERNRVKPPKEKKPWAFRKTAFSFNRSKPMKRSGRIKPATKKSNLKIQMDRMDILWTKAIKTRAGFASEYSGLGRWEGHLLHAHHIKGKATWALRYSLDNGVCITGEEHTTLAHGPADAAAAFETWALALRAPAAINNLSRLANAAGQTNLEEIEFFLKETLAGYAVK